MWWTGEELRTFCLDEASEQDTSFCCWSSGLQIVQVLPNPPIAPDTSCTSTEVRLSAVHNPTGLSAVRARPGWGLIPGCLPKSIRALEEFS